MPYFTYQNILEHYSETAWNYYSIYFCFSTTIKHIYDIFLSFVGGGVTFSPVYNKDQDLQNCMDLSIVKREDIYP